MVAVKKLMPYFIKADMDYVRIILDYQYFTLIENKELYQFVPFEAKEIRVNRKTRKIENIEAVFSFKKDNEIIHIAMSELVLLPDFIIQLHIIAEPYYSKEIAEYGSILKNRSIITIDALEQLNIKRLIDRALDERDEETFDSLVKLL